MASTLVVDDETIHHLSEKWKAIVVKEQKKKCSDLSLLPLSALLLELPIG